MYHRKLTKRIKVGNIYIGGSYKVYIQSMTNTKTIDLNNTLRQIKQLEDAGCELVRISVPDEESAKNIEYIKNVIKIPLVAYIHFDYKLAIMSIERGIDKIRINPGNINDKNKIKILTNYCNRFNIPIRIDINSGSLSKSILNKYNGIVTTDGLVESAIENVKILEEFNFNNIIVSMKSSNVLEMIAAYEKFSNLYNNPLNLGLTESGTILNESIKSSVALGILLNKNLGNTIRISLTANPIDEIDVANAILKSLELYNSGIDIISCPICARTNIDIIKISNIIQEKIKNIKANKNIKVAIMGCAVNGPGEAKSADIGIAGGNNEAVLFKKGIIIKKINENDIIDILINEINNIIKE